MFLPKLGIENVNETMSANIVVPYAYAYASIFIRVRTDPGKSWN